MQDAKRVLRYLSDTVNFSLSFECEGTMMECFSDSDWAGNVEDRKSTSGFLVKVYNTSVCWGSTKQRIVALSTTKAEHIALCEAAKSILWIRTVLEDMNKQVGAATIVYEDNQGAVVWSTDGTKNCKHVAVRRNFVKEIVNKGLIEIKYCPAELMLADIFTKALQKQRFFLLRGAIEIEKKTSQ